MGVRESNFKHSHPRIQRWGGRSLEGEDTFEDLGQLDETFVSESVLVSAEIVVVLDISRGNLGRLGRGHWNGGVIG